MKTLKPFLLFKKISHLNIILFFLLLNFHSFGQCKEQLTKREKLFQDKGLNVVKEQYNYTNCNELLKKEIMYYNEKIVFIFYGYKKNSKFMPAHDIEDLIKNYTNLNINDYKGFQFDDDLTVKKNNKFLYFRKDFAGFALVAYVNNSLYKEIFNMDYKIL